MWKDVCKNKTGTIDAYIQTFSDVQGFFLIMILMITFCMIGPLYIDIHVFISPFLHCTSRFPGNVLFSILFTASWEKLFAFPAERDALLVLPYV